MANAKRLPIWGSGSRAPSDVQGKAYIFSSNLRRSKYWVRTKLGGHVPPMATPSLEISLFISTCILFTRRIAATVRIILLPPSVSRIQACGFRTCCFRSGFEHFSLLIIPFSVFSHPSPSLTRVRRARRNIINSFSVSSRTRRIFLYSRVIYEISERSARRFSCPHG
jgi:hypothetical protein